jgi:GxxExxY protein
MCLLPRPVEIEHSTPWTLCVLILVGLFSEKRWPLHRNLGPGLLETVYEIVLADRLTAHGIQVERQREVPIVYDGKRFSVGFRVDLLVGQTLLVELKSVEALTAVHKKQLLAYLRLANCPVGLLINFGGSMIRGNVVRLVNGDAPDIKKFASHEGHRFPLPLSLCSSYSAASGDLRVMQPLRKLSPRMFQA